MIIGIGNDIVDIGRIEKAVNRFGDKFITRIFTPDEQFRASKSSSKFAALAKRFAAKEAAWKALGDGKRLGIKWTELSVINKKSGKPVLILSGAAEKRLKELVPIGMVARLDLSLSDEPPIAQALVVISADSMDQSLLRRRAFFIN